MIITVSLFLNHGTGDCQLHTYIKRIRIKHLPSIFWTVIDALSFNSNVEKVKLIMDQGTLHFLAGVDEKKHHVPFKCNEETVRELRLKGWRYDESFD